MKTWTKVCCRGSGCPSVMVDDNMVLIKDEDMVLSLALEEWEAMKHTVERLIVEQRQNAATDRA